MIFKDIFPISYATFCGVQLGESFVKRPENIGAGKWMKFWEDKLENTVDELTKEEYETEISRLEENGRELQSTIDQYDEEIDRYISENDDLRAENIDHERCIDELEEKIAKLSEDCLQADYALNSKFGDRV